MENRPSDGQVDALDTLRLKTPSAAVFRNCTMILMSDAGRSQASIGEDLGCGTATVECVSSVVQDHWHPRAEARQATASAYEGAAAGRGLGIWLGGVGLPHSGHRGSTRPVRLYPQPRQKPLIRLPERRHGPRKNATTGQMEHNANGTHRGNQTLR